LVSGTGRAILSPEQYVLSKRSKDGKFEQRFGNFGGQLKIFFLNGKVRESFFSYVVFNNIGRPPSRRR
jgi:hypothetical protein